MIVSPARDWVKQRFPDSCAHYREKYDFINRKLVIIHTVYRTKQEADDHFYAKQAIIGMGYTEQEAWRDAKNTIEIR